MLWTLILQGSGAATKYLVSNPKTVDSVAVTLKQEQLDSDVPYDLDLLSRDFDRSRKTKRWVVITVVGEARLFHLPAGL